MAGERSIHVPSVSAGYQQIASSGAPQALTLPGLKGAPQVVPTPVPSRKGSRWAIIQVSGGVIRWKDDDPADANYVAVTVAIGMRLLQDQTLMFNGKLSWFRFITESGAPIVNVDYYE